MTTDAVQAEEQLMAVPSQEAEEPTQAGLMEAVGSSGARKYKKRKKKRAPDAPRRAKSPYICFSVEMRPAIKEKLIKEGNDSPKVTEIITALADAWRKLDDSQKTTWVEKSAAGTRDDVVVTIKRKWPSMPSMCCG